MRPLHPSRVRGFSMVELMVAMLIGLIGMIIIFQVFEVSEGIKRSTTSGGDAQQNGAVALYVMEHDLRNAGMGFNDVPYAGCNVLAYDSKRAVPAFTMTLAPALICAPGSTAPGGSCPGTGIAGSTPDQVTVLYGSKSLIADATMLNSNMTLGTDPVQVMNAYAFQPGDLLVLLEPNSGKNCSLLEATSVASITVGHLAAGTTYPLSGGTQVTARFNSPAPGIAYGGVGSSGNVTRVFNLGNVYEPLGSPALPVYNTYAIDANNALALTQAFVSVTPSAPSAPQTSAVADNIVQLQAQYGLDDGTDNGSVTFSGTFAPGDGLVDRFVSPAVFNNIVPPPWQSLIAIRLAIVARSALPEKPLGSDGAKCDATTDGTEATPGPDRRPRWSGGVIDVSASGNPDPASPLHWKCYRYRVFETTVPLRNWIWKSS